MSTPLQGKVAIMMSTLIFAIARAVLTRRRKPSYPKYGRAGASGTLRAVIWRGLGHASRIETFLNLTLEFEKN